MGAARALCGRAACGVQVAALTDHETKALVDRGGRHGRHHNSCQCLCEMVRFGTQPAVEHSTAWLNSEPLTAADLRGKVVLVDFWTYTCINSRRTLPCFVHRIRSTGAQVWLSSACTHPSSASRRTSTTCVRFPAGRQAESEDCRTGPARKLRESALRLNA
jgi:hypothetical protein